MNANTKWISEDQKSAIDKAVRDAESATSGEIVPVLAMRSGDYAEGLYQAAIGTTCLATLALVGLHCIPSIMEVRAPWEIPLLDLLPVQILALVTGYRLALSWPRFHRAFLPQPAMERQVDVAALRVFDSLGLRKTTGATAIMIYVSVFERVALVLADKAIADTCPPDTWRGVRDLLIGGLKKDDPVAGFTSAIAECGRILKDKFPVQPGDVNELENHLRIMDGSRPVN